jgi:hypothetical protein
MQLRDAKLNLAIFFMSEALETSHSFFGTSNRPSIVHEGAHALIQLEGVLEVTRFAERLFEKSLMRPQVMVFLTRRGSRTTYTAPSHRNFEAY